MIFLPRRLDCSRRDRRRGALKGCGADAECDAALLAGQAPARSEADQSYVDLNINIHNKIYQYSFIIIYIYGHVLLGYWEQALAHIRSKPAKDL